MSTQTIKNPTEWLEQRSELGWTIVDEIRCNEPIFDEVTGEQEIVALTEYHFEDEGQGYAGILQISVGNGWSLAEFMPFTFVGMGE